MEELVSVVMPTHNRENLLPRAINSVLKQTYKNWELIIVDDASKDNTSQVVSDFIIRDSRVKYYKLETNQGACVARNKGIEESGGKYITFLDSDDEYLPEKIELQVNCLNTSSVNNLGVVSCGRIDVRNGKEYNQWIPSLQGNILRDLLLKNKIGAGTPFLMVKKSVLKDYNVLFDPEMPAGQDWDFLIRVCQHTNFDVVKKPLVRVHHHSGERVYNSERAVNAFRKQYDKYKDLLSRESEVHDTFVLKMAVQCFIYGYQKRAQDLLSHEILNRNFKVRLWLTYIQLFNNQRTIVNKATFKALKKLTSL